MSNQVTVAQALEILASALEACKGVDMSTALPAQLVPLATAAKDVAGFLATVDAEINTRVIGNNESIPGVAVKPQVKHRFWNDEELAGDLAYASFGLKAFKLLSPAAIEKLGPEGEALVSVASTKPEAGKKVVY